MNPRRHLIKIREYSDKLGEHDERAVPGSGGSPPHQGAGSGRTTQVLTEFWILLEIQSLFALSLVLFYDRL